MPFPVVHAVAGYTVYQISKKQEASLNWKLALYCMVMGNFADLDFIPGLLIGQATRFHHGITHSFGFALIAGLAAAFLVKLFKKKDPLKAFLVTSIAYASHVFLDIVNGAWKPMPIFWPLTNKTFFGQPAAVLPEHHCPFHDGLSTFQDFIRFLTQPYYLKQMAGEFLLFVTIIGLIHVGMEIRKRFRFDLQGSRLILPKD